VSLRLFVFEVKSSDKSLYLLPEDLINQFVFCLLSHMQTISS
jgi:hypothetical protein